MRNRHIVELLILATLLCALAQAQTPSQPAPQTPPQTQPERDSLGRDTPRGTVFGFLGVTAKGDFETAANYLDTRLRGERAIELAKQLSVVMNRRLPAKLNQLSDRPEGSKDHSDGVDADLVGTIDSFEGPVEILVRRVKRRAEGQVWLFAKDTLDMIPGLFDEVNRMSVESVLPAFLTGPRIAGISLFHWLFLLVVLPLLYVLITLLRKLVRPLAGSLLRRLLKREDLAPPEILPQPVRLLILVAVIRWMIVSVNLPLLARQFWSAVGTVFTVAAITWMLLLVNGWVEGLARERLGRGAKYGAVSMLRLARRTADLLVIFGSVLVVLHLFRVNITAALAGLGVGGIAVALAAQKTLENVIGGISIIADRAVRVGNFMKVADAVGTVEDVGLRSTRIRTMDRTVVSIPNGSISNVVLEDFSRKDKCWFHPILRLRYETTADEMRAVLAGIRTLLERDRRIEKDSIRVRFLGFGASSLDVEVFAYILTVDYSFFLEVQEELFLRIMDVVQDAGTRIALPAQTTYLAQPLAADSANVADVLKARS